MPAHERRITVVSLAKPRSDSSEHETRNRAISTIRIEKVISEINEFQTRTEEHLQKDAKKQAKELLWFFSIFTVYIMFGVFLFFYIEECSGAKKPDDNSVTHKDVTKVAPYKNVTKNCYNIYKSILKAKNITTTTTTTATNITNGNNNRDVNITMFKNTMYDFDEFLSQCKSILGTATIPIVVLNATKTKCSVDEYQLMKYAEFTIFTLLLIGYGNTTPETVIGRYTTIIYALFGMPLALTMYSVAGKLVVQIITLCVRKFETRVLKVHTEIKHVHIKTLSISFLILIVIVLIGCSVTTSSQMENLDFSSSIYFWFVSLSTIGYGDITFLREKHLRSPHLMLIATFNTLFGLGILVATFEALSSTLEKRDLTMSTMVIDEDGNVDKNTGKSGSQKYLLKDAVKKYDKMKEERKKKISLNNKSTDAYGTYENDTVDTVVNGTVDTVVNGTVNKGHDSDDYHNDANSNKEIHDNNEPVIQSISLVSLEKGHVRWNLSEENYDS